MCVLLTWPLMTVSLDLHLAGVGFIFTKLDIAVRIVRLQDGRMCDLLKACFGKNDVHFHFEQCVNYSKCSRVLRAYRIMISCPPCQRTLRAIYKYDHFRHEFLHPFSSAALTRALAQMFEYKKPARGGQRVRNAEYLESVESKKRSVGIRNTHDAAICSEDQRANLRKGYILM
ncbi:hypothetical protein NEOLEDRAFT_165840 [Neolentinus lepideus HHB14362 ss-1]|uniref:Uncharacterized protein n=1 Tax=Neolentinus lepideus HHB14362 ss-1 TaxID=1314782 RepID=A0A165TVJ6_9AGAM|nr:hypothetical protein NEOLEDRAFT_165840 [Neolentinus lepideus HHB14362 ss-1]